jgi:3-methyladenine DNA glycosylase AlkD
VVGQPPTAAKIKAELEELRDSDRAEFIGTYLGIAPGGYGEGDVLLGMPVPEQRKVARANWDAPREVCVELLQSEVHEHRLVALVILRHRFERGDRDLREAIADLYLEHRGRVNNWDLVDSSAPYLLADRVRDAPRDLIDPLIASPVVWDRRIGMLATFSLIKAGEFGETLRVAALLLDDEHDLMHKATGWMLREVGKRDISALRGFLSGHAGEMPRTALRYAIEKMPKDERARWMKAG